MPAEAVVDRMVVQLLGDAASYKQMMNEAKKITEETTRDMTGRLRDTRGRYVAEMKLMRAETDITLDKINKMLAEAHGPSQLTRDLEATHGSIKKLGVIAGHVGPQMEAFGKKMTIATLPLTLLGGLAIDRKSVV